ncbi:hypothetical protein BU26DRAFT_291081 [Trematosphaeria pertusa]|uniref:Uncharacterized protein n=1 Tax=Trematosphaeria pertusa TaxID=390896 RepID=A0A6A6IIZ5_9PLEO|nr:uncharacterized protein BU26DRAFT_291081 [Trematosphaeria pertusa]KAF2249852.1 hypothetical protein BU26DRAFT_291081 [Trematosphaeria pertusa]
MEISPQGLLHFLKDGGLPEEYYPPLQVYLQGMLTSHNPPGKNYISVANAEKFARRCGFLDKLMPTINQARADEPKQLQLQCSLCGVEFLTICKGRGALVHIESHAHELGLPKLSKGKLRRCHFLGCNAVMDQRWPNYKSHFSVCPFAP